MNKFLTKQIIYANRIARYIDFAYLDFGILTSESKKSILLKPYFYVFYC